MFDLTDQTAPSPAVPCRTPFGGPRATRRGVGQVSRRASLRVGCVLSHGRGMACIVRARTVHR